MKIDISAVDHNALKLIKEVLVCYYDGNEAEAKSALHEIAGIVDLAEALKETAAEVSNEVPKVSKSVSKVSKKALEEDLKVSSKDEPEELAEEESDVVEKVDNFMEEFEIKPTLKHKRGGKKKQIDEGKIKALRKAGWSLAKIADEMRCSTQTIANRLAEMEVNNETD